MKRAEQAAMEALQEKAAASEAPAASDEGVDEAAVSATAAGGAQPSE